MRICFWHSDKPREHLLADAFADGVRATGFADSIELRALQPEPEAAKCDLAVMVGVKSRRLFEVHQHAGSHVLYLDKGYTRHAADSPVKLWEYWRVALDSHQPGERLWKVPRPDDRAEALKILIQPWRNRTGKDSHVLIAGSSQKYHDFYGLKDPTTWAIKLVNHLKRETKRPIVYRPKPSWSEAVPIEGTTFSHGRCDLLEDMADAFCMITHGSNAVFEAMIAGVPQITLGPAVTSELCAHQVGAVNALKLASFGDRYQWLNNVAYWQYTMPEIAKGELWRFIRPQLYG